MVVWTIPSLGVSQLRLIWSTGSMQVFPWEQDRGVRPAFPLPDKAIHTHIHTLMCTHMPATIWLELASCPLWRVEPVTRWHPSVRKSFSEGGSERKFKARWQETVTDSLFFSSGHNPNPPPIHTHPSSRQICYDYLVKPNLIGKSWTWSDGPNLCSINSQQCTKNQIYSQSCLEFILFKCCFTTHSICKMDSECISRSNRRKHRNEGTVSTASASLESQ